MDVSGKRARPSRRRQARTREHHRRVALRAVAVAAEGNAPAPGLAGREHDAARDAGGKIFLKDSRLMGASMTLPLPNIHISKIQTGPDGSSPEEIAGQVMESLFSSSKSAVGQTASSVVDQGAKELKEAGEAASKAIKGAGSDLGSSVKKLFSRE